MITLNIENTRSCKLTKNEEVRKGDNNISAFSIVFPSNFGAGHPRAECAVEMRCYLPNGEFLSYELDTSQPIATQPITYDLTEQEQQVSIMFIITHGVEVIGKTNSETLYVYDAPDSDREPLTPREDFDRVINEQRQTIARQAATIDEQSETIGSQGERITELNGEVTELQGEVAEQAATITRQNTTIDELNRRVPPLQTLNPINPSQIQQTFNPESPNIGFPQVIVNAPTAEGLGFDYGNLKKDVEFLGGVGTYDPFPYNSVGGIYITEIDEDFNIPLKVVIINFPLATAPSIYDRNYIQEVTFENCSSVVKPGSNFMDYIHLKKLILTSLSSKNIGDNFCDGCISLMELSLPQQLKTIGFGSFRNCKALANLYLPATLTTINNAAFIGCSKLENVVLGENFNCSINLSSSTLYSQETIVSWLEALADRTGQTAYTLIIGAPNLNKLTTEQKAIAIGKNWNLA